MFCIQNGPEMRDDSAPFQSKSVETHINVLIFLALNLVFGQVYANSLQSLRKGDLWTLLRLGFRHAGFAAAIAAAKFAYHSNFISGLALTMSISRTLLPITL